MENKINKPFDLLLFDTRESLINTLNDSGLPITVMSMLLKELLQTVSMQEGSAINKQRMEFSNALKLAQESED